MNYQVFDQMIEGVSVINRERECIYTNKAFQDQFSRKAEEIVGRKVSGIFPGFEGELYDLFEKTMNEKVPTRKINYYRCPEGDATWTSVRMSPIDEGVLLMTFDLTEQKRMEEEIKVANKLLESRVKKRTHELSRSLRREKELNRVKTTFVSMASHELKTPLSAILSSTSLIEQYIKKGTIDKSEKHFGRIKTSVKNMVDLLNDFLSIDQLQQGVIKTTNEEFSLGTLLEDIEEELLLSVKTKQKVHYSIKGVDCVVLDRHILRHILLNLISNALKYSEDDVLVEVLVSNVIEIIIKDKGIGIPQHQVDDIFSQFFRASNVAAIEGTGLGLNIVKHYVDLLDGDISFESKEGIGTLFKVILENKSNSF
ncbi:ATP-binding protein [Wenyingzhuangia sp. IMCC45574]